MHSRYAVGPHTTARTAVVWDVLRREIDRASRAGTDRDSADRDSADRDRASRAGTGTPRTGLIVVDVGGGTGGFAVPLAQAGHAVTVVDSSPDALAALTRRAAEAGVGDAIRAVQGDADALTDLIAPGEADLVLCHSVLEVVEAPGQVAAALAATLRRGGAASVIVANRAAAVLTRAMSGHLDAAAILLADPDGRAGERDHRRFDAGSATELLATAGLDVEEIHGVRVIIDLVPASVQERDQDALAAFELATSSLSPFRDIASQLHLLARRP